MQKRNILILLILLVAFSIKAEENKIRFSIFASPTINWFKSDVRSAKNESAVMGYNIGFGMDKYFAEHYAVSTGASITNLGGKLKYNYIAVFNTPDTSIQIPANVPIKHKLQYISIPLGLKFTSREIGYTTIYANLGFSSHLNINAVASTEDNQATLDHDNISKDIRFFNLAYYFGGGILYSLGGNTAIIFGINFSNGLLDVTKERKDKIVSMSFTFHVGMQF
ncbi:MAG: PorT family protein [Bacteroidales bacterium]|nr:PorT family protein [Bacteroidales bacterium]